MMKLVSVLAAGAVAAFVYAVPAWAALTIDNATVDSGTTTTVAPNGSVTVAITVSGSSNTNWACSGYKIDNGTVVTVNTNDHNENDILSATESFEISAPSTPGTYNLTVYVWSNGGCNNDQQSTLLENAITVEEGGGAVESSLEKFLISGPLESSDYTPPLGCSSEHYDGTEAPCDGFATNFDTNPNDAGPIGLNLLFSQHYVVEIRITNHGEAGDLDGTVVTDTFGADFDVDPVAHADYDYGGLPLDGLCDDGGEVDCSTIDPLNWTGLVFDDAACSAHASQPPQDNSSKQPEFIDIRVNHLDEDESCSVYVFVQTVLNPGGGNEFFEPTGCRELFYTTGDGETGDPIHDTFTLNEGLKSFDGTTGERIEGPTGSLQLTCNAALPPT